MRPTAAGFYPNFMRGSPVLDAQVLAATPLGKDAAGANLTAYIVRSDEETPAPRTGNSANANDVRAPAASFQENLIAAEQVTVGTLTSARFLKPDSLLSRLEKAQVDHLRARDDAIKKEVSELTKTGASGFALIYETGPDGRKYAVGVAAPLLPQNAFESADEPPKALSEQEHDKGILAYQTRLGTAQPLRAGMTDQAL